MDCSPVAQVLTVLQGILGTKKTKSLQCCKGFLCYRAQMGAQGCFVYHMASNVGRNCCKEQKLFNPQTGDRYTQADSVWNIFLCLWCFIKSGLMQRSSQCDNRPLITSPVPSTCEIPCSIQPNLQCRYQLPVSSGWYTFISPNCCSHTFQLLTHFNTLLQSRIPLLLEVKRRFVENDIYVCYFSLLFCSLMGVLLDHF